MKTPVAKIVIVASVLLSTVAVWSVAARLMEDWSYQDLFTKSDFVVVAKPVAATRDTKERSALRDIEPAEPVIGVTTEFQTLLVLKGSKRERFTLHHYRRESNVAVVNAPALVSFDPVNDHRRYLLFLVHEPDDRFAPVAGQTDPKYISAQELSGMVE